jgi:hypothetical protein
VSLRRLQHFFAIDRLQNASEMYRLLRAGLAKRRKRR